MVYSVKSPRGNLSPIFFTVSADREVTEEINEPVEEPQRKIKRSLLLDNRPDQ